MDAEGLVHHGVEFLFDGLRRLTLKDHGMDPGVVQQLPQQQPGGARANNRDLCLHRDVSLLQG